MPYIYGKCVAGKTEQHWKCYSKRWPGKAKGEKRGKKIKETSPAQKKGNLRRLADKLTWIMNANFVDGDFMVTLDYRKDARPGNRMQLKKDARNFLDKLRRKLKKQGKELQYIHVMEVGERGAMHHHLLIKEMDIKTLRECWPYGGIQVDPLWSEGQYRKIAEYFIKYTEKTMRTEAALMTKHWYASRNLVIPEPEKKVIKAGYFKKVINVPAGYYLDKESVAAGVNEEGFDYFTYTLIQMERKRGRGG